MPRPRVAMRQIREVLRLTFGERLSRRQVGAATGVPVTTVSDYIQRARAAGVGWPLPADLDDEGLERLLYPPVAPSRVLRPAPDWGYVHRELRRKGVTLQLLWLEYRQAHPDGYGYRALRAWLGHRHATWPRTSSRHVLISEKTALGSGPVSRGYLVWNLQRHGVSIERIRRDRVLHDALTASADPLHLVLVFGMSHTTASRYTLIACDLLTDQPTEAGGQ